MDPLNKKLADFKTILEIYQQQELKFEEIQLQEEKLLEAEIERNYQTLEIEVTKYEEALTESKLNEFKLKKIAHGKCEIISYQTEKFKSQQEKKQNLEHKGNELSKCKRQNVNKFLDNLEKLRLQFDFENLSESILDAKEKLVELHQQAENDQKSKTVILEKYQKMPKRTIELEVKIANQSLPTTRKSLKEIKTNRNRLLSFLSSLKEEEKKSKAQLSK